MLTGSVFLCSYIKVISLKKINIGNGFPGSSVIKAPLNAGVEGSIPGWGTKVLHVTECSQTFKKN